MQIRQKDIANNINKDISDNKYSENAKTANVRPIL